MDLLPPIRDEFLRENLGKKDFMSRVLPPNPRLIWNLHSTAR
jgi:hypothetical protein